MNTLWGSTAFSDVNGQGENNVVVVNLNFEDNKSELKIYSPSVVTHVCWLNALRQLLKCISCALFTRTGRHRERGGGERGREREREGEREGKRHTPTNKYTHADTLTHTSFRIIFWQSSHLYGYPCGVISVRLSSDAPSPGVLHALCCVCFVCFGCFGCFLSMTFSFFKLTPGRHFHFGYETSSFLFQINEHSNWRCFWERTVRVQEPAAVLQIRSSRLHGALSLLFFLFCFAVLLRGEEGRGRWLLRLVSSSTDSLHVDLIPPCFLCCSLMNTRSTFGSARGSQRYNHTCVCVDLCMRVSV